MQTIEILLYFAAVLIIGGMIIIAITGIGYEGIHQSFKRLFNKGEDTDFEGIGKDSAYMKIYAFYEECIKTEGNISTSFYIKDGGNLSKELIFSYYKNLSWCESIQSQDNNCGKREDIIMTNNLTLPKVLTLYCINNSKVSIN